MTESAYSSIHGAEISERSTELVLPSSPATTGRGDPTEIVDVTGPQAERAWRTASIAAGSVVPEPDFSSPRPATTPSFVASSIASPTAPPFSASIAPSSATSGARASSLAGGLAAPSAPRGPIPTEATNGEARATAESSAPDRGRALPGDRGPRDPDPGTQRPSFWRRIALGRRSQALQAAQREAGIQADSIEFEASARSVDTRAVTPAAPERRLVERGPAEISARGTEAIERRIVEPLLQALVSVEAKLERSHVDLLGRSDQVEQRLTQLWDIEEQLGALGELQESVLQVTEQQRRLESALVAQTRILRWLVGGIILSLSVAAFSVAFLLAWAR